jgi:hypothetical protein
VVMCPSRRIRGSFAPFFSALKILDIEGAKIRPGRNLSTRSLFLDMFAGCTVQGINGRNKAKLLVMKKVRRRVFFQKTTRWNGSAQDLIVSESGPRKSM